MLKDNKRSQVKYERYEKEREAKMLAKEKIKLLQRELNISNMERRKLNDQIVRSYKEISRLKNFESENKSLKRDKTELLEELQKASRENHKLQKKIIKLYEVNSYGNEAPNGSDFESPLTDDDQILQDSQLFSNSEDRNVIDFNMNKSTDYYEDEGTPGNSKSMVMSKRVDRNKYLNSNPRLNETVVSERGVNRFQKKILLDKEKEIEVKNQEIYDISRKYEYKIRELNKSRNDDRDKYETKLQGLGKSFKTLTHRKRVRNINSRAMTPVS